MEKKRVLYTGIYPPDFLNDCIVFHQPMIKIIRVADPKEIDERIDQITQYHCIIFASRFAAENFLNRVFERKFDNNLLRHLKIVAQGKATATYLKDKGLASDFVIEEESVDGIVDGIIEALPKSCIKGRRILIPGSILSSPELGNKLRENGALVDNLVVYQTVKPDNVEKINLSSVDEAYFLSPWGFDNFLEIYKEIPQHLKIKAIGKPAQEYIIDKGYKAQLI